MTNEIYNGNDHTFALCAYKESRYLEECVQSLLSQSVKSNIIIVTSTPNGHISDVAEKYGLPLFVNTGEKGIGKDWNFAYSNCKTKLITIAHQDDIYESDYLKQALEFINTAKEPIIYFCGYSELRNGKKIYNNRLLNFKKLMLLPLKPKFAQKNKFIRRRVLSFGCPICCPSVIFVKEKIGDKPFTDNFLSDMDWEEWETLSKKDGSFVYNAKPLMCHRIHKESATSEIIGKNKRFDEDYRMFLKFWHKPTAKLLVKLYSKSQSSNNL